VCVCVRACVCVCVCAYVASQLIFILLPFFITGENCIVQGQIYLQQAPPPECQPTCSHPTRDCRSTAPRPGCVCPEGTVIDETQNRCVPIPQCSKPASLKSINIYLHILITF